MGRAVARLDRVNRLIKQPGFDPTVHRRSADADASRRVEAGSPGLLQQMS